MDDKLDNTININKIRTVYFSPTGTTAKVVLTVSHRLAELLNCETKQFDFTMPTARQQELRFSNKDVVIFGVPVYAGRVPNILLKYLETLMGDGSLAVPVVVFGNRNYDEALKELYSILKRQGFRSISAAAAFVGEHAFSKVLGIGRPDEADLAAIDDFASGIAAKLTGDIVEEQMCTGGSILPFESFLKTTQEPLGGYYQPRDRDGNPIDIRNVKPKTNEHCINCGYCAQICPMGSINQDDVNVFVGICIKCGACIKKCPEQARYYDDAHYLYHKEELEQQYTCRAEPTLFL